MALSERQEIEVIEIVSKYKQVQVKRVTIISRDGEDISKSNFRYVLSPGYLNEAQEFVDTDLSDQPSEVSSICQAAWTQSVKDAWRDFLILQDGEGL